MTFSNIPNGESARGYSQYLTRDDNISNNWCGAQLPNSSDNGGNKSISTTEELLTLVNDMNKRLYTLAAAVVALSNR